MDHTMMDSLNAYSKSRLMEDIKKTDDSNILSALLVIFSDYKGHSGKEQEERAFFLSEITNVLTSLSTKELQQLYQDMNGME